MKPATQEEINLFLGTSPAVEYLAREFARGMVDKLDRQMQVGPGPPDLGAMADDLDRLVCKYGYPYPTEKESEMAKELLKTAKFDRVMVAQAAGLTNINGDSVDMTDFESVTFVAAFGAIVATAVTGLKAQQSSDDGAADAFADILGTAIAIADTDDNKILVLQIRHPTERWVRPVVTRGTANAIIDGVIAIIGEPARPPVTQPADVAASEIHSGAKEGAA